MEQTVSKKLFDQSLHHNILDISSSIETLDQILDNYNEEFRCIDTLGKFSAIFSLPVRKYRKSYCTTPNIGIGGSIGIYKNVKVLRQSF